MTQELRRVMKIFSVILESVRQSVRNSLVPRIFSGYEVG